MDKKEKLYTAIFLVGIVTLAGGLLHSYIAGFLIQSNVMIASYDWIIMIGIIVAFTGLILLISKRYNIAQKHVIKANILEVILIIILIVSSASVGGWLYGQYQNTLLVSTEKIQKIDEQLKMMDQMEDNNPFYCKKVIIRDDDIGDSRFLPSLQWISNRVMKKMLKLHLP